MHQSPQPPRQDLAIPLPHLLCSLTAWVFQMEHFKYFRLARIRCLLCKERIDCKPLGAGSGFRSGVVALRFPKVAGTHGVPFAVTHKSQADGTWRVSATFV